MFLLLGQNFNGMMGHFLELSYLIWDRSVT